MMEQMLTAMVMAFCVGVVLFAIIPKDRMNALVAFCTGVVSGFVGIAVEHAIR